MGQRLLIQNLGYINARVQEHFSEKKMFQDLNRSIYHPVLTLFGSIKDNSDFNPKPLKFRDFIVMSVIEHAQIVRKIQRPFCKGKHWIWIWIYSCLNRGAPSAMPVF